MPSTTQPETNSVAPTSTFRETVGRTDLKLAPTPVKVHPTDPGARHMVGIRESTKYDASLLHGMATQVLTRAVASNVAGAATVLEACGEDHHSFLPYIDTPAGRAWRREHDSRELREPGGRVYGYSFVVDGTTFIIAATSATEEDENEQNPFTSDLMQLLLEVRPDYLWTGPPSRLMRRRRFAAQLFEVVKTLKLTVVSSTSTFDFRTERETAETLWDQAATFSHREVLSIKLRTDLGKIHGARANRWSEAGTPAVGYLDRGPRGELEVTSDEQALTEYRVLFEQVLQAARVGASYSGDLATTIAAALDAAGHRDANGKRLVGRNGTTSMVETRLNWLAYALEGGRTRTLMLSDRAFAANDVLVPVLHDADGNAFVELEWDWTPLGETLDLDDAAVKTVLEWLGAVLEGSRKREARTEHRLPLGDVRVRIDGAPAGREWSLVREGSRYVIREHDEATTPCSEETETTIIASSPWHELHPAVVDALMEAAANEEFDLKVELDAQRLAEDTTPAGPEVVAARRTLREAEIELRKHQDGKEAIEAIGLDPQLAAPALSAAEAKITTAKTEVDAAAAALAELEADAVATQVAADIPSVAHALALLAEERTVSPRLREILSRIIDLLVLRPDPTTGKIHGEVSLRLNDSTGIARVTTPAMFTVKGSRRGYIEQTDDDGKTFVRRDRQSRIEHPNQLIGHLLSDARTSPQDKAERRRWAAALTASSPGYRDQRPAVARWVAAALIDCPVPSTRHVLLSMLAADGRLPWQQVEWEDGTVTAAPPVPTTIEDLDEPQTDQWLDHLRTTYLDVEVTNDRRPGGWSNGGERYGRSVLAAVAQRAGSEVDATEYAAICALSRLPRTSADLRLLIERGKRPGLTVVGDDRSGRVALAACRFCGSAGPLQVVNAVEIPSGMICRECRAEQQTGHTVPSSYLADLEGPLSTKAKRSTMRHCRPDDLIGSWVAPTPASPLTPATGHVAASKGRKKPNRSDTRCKFPTCTNRVRQRRQGAPRKYCREIHADGNTRKKLLREMEQRPSDT